MANAGGLNKKAKVENDDLLKLVTFQLGEELSEAWPDSSPA